MFDYLKALVMPKQSNLVYSAVNTSLESLTTTVRQSHADALVYENTIEIERDNNRTKETTSSSIIGVLGAKGGVGATTLAINLAGSFAKQKGSTTLVDANLQQPDAALMLGKEFQFSLIDLVNKTDNLTGDVIDACRMSLTDQISQSYLLSPPINGEAVLKTHLTQVIECLEAMKTSCRYWIVDLPKHLDRHLVVALDSLNLIILVLEPTSTGLSAAKRWINVFNDLGYYSGKIVCVLNRAGSKSRNLEAEAKAILRGHPFIKIPNAFILTEKTFLSGLPAVVREPRAPYSKAVFSLAIQLTHFLENDTKHE